MIEKNGKGKWMVSVKLVMWLIGILFVAIPTLVFGVMQHSVATHNTSADAHPHIVKKIDKLEQNMDKRFDRLEILLQEIAKDG